MPKTFYLFGTTCVGKDYMTDYACDKYHHAFGSVNVGKEFRKRYPPEFFEGKGAMQKTEDEAFSIFKEQWDEQAKEGKSYILVSGQPRLESQIDRICKYAPGQIIWLFASNETLLARLEKRFAGQPSGRELSMKRLENDRIQLYEVAFHLMDRGIKVRTLNVEKYDPRDTIDQIYHFGDF